jgi:hypothetical protein
MRSPPTPFARAFGALFLSIVATLAGAPAAAAPSARDKAEAKNLVGEAKAALKQQRFDYAIRVMKEAEALDPSPALEVDLADALAQAGRLVDASKMLHAAEGAPATTPAAKKTQEAAKKQLAELEARIPHIKVTATDGAAIKIDGAEVSEGDVAVDPGDHKVTAEADGFDPAEKTVHVAEGAHERVKLKLSPAGTAAKPAEEADSGGGGSKLPAVIAFGVGAVGLGVGTAFGILAFSQTSAAKSECSAFSICPQSDASTISSAQTAGNVSTVGFIAGGVGVAAGVVLLIVSSGSKKAPEKKESATVTPWVGLGQAGVTGRF